MERPVIAPGDCLLYRPTDLIGKLICLKTWSPYSHCETYVGGGKSIGARKEGVNLYPVRWDKLAMILRPDPGRLNLKAGMAWFDANAKGQAYDFLGLFRFFTWGKQSTDRQFCSELLTRFYRHAGFPDLFGINDADLIPPGWFATMAGFRQVWSDV